MEPEELTALKRAGYIVFQLLPGQWRVRGEMDGLTVWPIQKVCRSQHSSAKPIPYENILDIARANISPWPD